jgi:hypothetical protein
VSFLVNWSKPSYLKNFILFVVCSLSLSLCYAQMNGPAIYADIGGGTGTFTSYKMGVNCFWGRHHSVGAYFRRHWRNGHAVPDDYRGGLSLFNADDRPNDRMTFGSATYGWVLPMTEEIRFNLKGGGFAGVYQYPENFKRNSGSGFISIKNYTFGTLEDPLYGILINPVAEFAFSNSFGFTLGGSCMFSNVETFYSLDLTIIAGSVREPLKKRRY